MDLNKLIKEARERYPEGTKFYPAHLHKSHTLSLDLCVSTGNFRISTNESVCVDIDTYEPGLCANPIVYSSMNRKWAEIIEKPKEMKEKSITLTLEQAQKMYKKSPEMDELLLANFSKEELEKPELPKSWNDLQSISGYFIALSDGDVLPCEHLSTHDRNRNVFTTLKQAQSALAMAQLSQLMKEYNDGWDPDWDDVQQYKFAIKRYRNQIFTESASVSHYFLVFKTKKLRDEFLKNFEPLIKQYYMID